MANNPTNEKETSEEQQAYARVRSRARHRLPLLYDDLRGATGKTRDSIEAEIDEWESLLEEQGWAYDHRTRQLRMIANEEDEEEG
jgi:hypothetical protein